MLSVLNAKNRRDINPDQQAGPCQRPLVSRPIPRKTRSLDQLKPVCIVPSFSGNTPKGKREIAPTTWQRLKPKRSGERRVSKWTDGTVTTAKRTGIMNDDEREGDRGRNAMFSSRLSDIHHRFHKATGFVVLNTLFSSSIICMALTTTQSCDATSFH